MSGGERCVGDLVGNGRSGSGTDGESVISSGRISERGGSLARRCDLAMPISVALVVVHAPLLMMRHLVAPLPREIGTTELSLLAGLGKELVTDEAAPFARYASGSIPRNGCTCRASASGAGSATPAAAPKTAMRRGRNMNVEAMDTMARRSIAPAATAPTRL